MEPPLRFRFSGAPMRSQRLILTALAVLFSCCFAARLRAQSPPPNSPYTFHIYEDLVQVPTLVQDSSEAAVPNLKATDFTVSLDGGPRFHPRHIRLEGEDPISLTILLDVSTRQAARLAKELRAAADSIPGGWLNPRDHITIYALDCSLVRTAFDLPYSRETLDTGLRDAINSPLLKAKPTNLRGCNSDRLWDDLGIIIRQISGLPGRRVLLALTDGEDRRSVNKWTQLQLYAGQFSITLLGFQPVDSMLLLHQFGNMSLHAQLDNSFTALCASTGGTSLFVQDGHLTADLQRAITLLRQRYILEFPRPLKGSVGLHGIEVRVPEGFATVRPSGITFPAHDDSVMADPTTLTSDPSRAPQFGDRKIIAQPH